jgi:anaerobic selenocysteine-containing dehydrogenase
MKTSRRNLLTFAGGAAAALPFTPVPWKLADDISIWTQNWSWTPVPRRGELNARYTTCTLCPAGCGVKARCIGTQPISLAPVAGHPVSCGALCPLAFGAHQLPYHPLRARQILRDGRPVAIETAFAHIAARAKSGRAVVLEESPGGSASLLYGRLAAGSEKRAYVVPRNHHAATLEAIASAAGLPARALGFDLDSVRTVLSFGAPLLDGWGTPGRVLALWREKKLRIIQAEPSLSRTATLADRWLPIRPRSEGALARALAGFISLSEASVATGVPAAVLEEVARELSDNGPAVALSGGVGSAQAEAGIAALNATLGMNGVVRRRGELIAAGLFDDVEPASIDLLLIDHGPSGGALSWEAIEPKLAPKATVVSLTPYVAGVAARAHYVIPAPAFLESTQDRLTPWDAAVESYTVAPALLPAMPGCVEAADFIARVFGSQGRTLAKCMDEQFGALHTAKRGEVFDFATAERKPVAEYESPEKLAEAFAQGACWIGDGATQAVRCAATDPGPDPPLERGILLVSVPAAAVAPPLATKLDQESRVRRRNGRAYMHPKTASFRTGDRVRVEAGRSSFAATVELDASVAPGVIEAVSAAAHGLTPVSLRRS